MVREGAAANNEVALYWVPDIAHALRRLGELYDAQGNDAKAVEYYARFVELWKDADPELQPMVPRLTITRPAAGGPGQHLATAAADVRG